MNRHLLRIIIALGLVVSIVSGAGVFAVFSDRATAGASVDSGEVAKAADLQLAIPDDFQPGGLWDCGTDYHDDLTTLFDATDAQPGHSAGSGGVCIRNVGSAAVRLSLSAIDLVDLELGCTGDELVADPDCADETGAGQLGAVLRVGYSTFVCDGASNPRGGQVSLTSLTTTPVDVVPPFATDDDADGFLDPILAAGATLCVVLYVDYPATTAADDVQAAQSDRVTWRFAFDGVAS